MKTPISILRLVLVGLFVLLAMPAAQGQLLKKLGKRAERAAERTIERRVEKETTKKTDQVLDSILEPGSKGPDQTPAPEQGPSDNMGEGGSSTSQGGNTSGQGGNAGQGANGGPKTLQVYSKFDFVPGDEILFYDDFSNDFIGDFPAKWNTNGGGEVVSFGDDSGNWLELIPGNRTYYIADLNGLPADYTVEFDMEVTGIDGQTSSNATLRVILDDNDKFSHGKNSAWAYLPLAQYIPLGIRMWNQLNGERTISNTVDADIRQNVLNRPHISIAVNEQRYRLYVDETKYVDIPRLIAPGAPMTHLKFQLTGTKDGKEKVFIKNIKVAKGGVDLRRKLLSEGRISTNAILFDSGSARLQPESMGVIRQIYQVLQQDQAIRLQIVGHTDSDGEEEANRRLSEERAASVREALVSVYGVDGGRLETLGKGESEPVSDNSDAAGKAQNRRVEFIKM